MFDPRLEFRCPYPVVLATEVFRTPSERQQGLRHRTSWTRATATFVFPEPTYPTFEMRDTPLPMDILFVSRTGEHSGVVGTVEPATPYVTVVRRGPAQWVIEMPAGMAAQFAIMRGVPVTFHDVQAAID